ncbi:hypothetical protein K7X08_035256 [Anisodus acutangulus]|uniref:Uncharacterized protein n=1 Tax=Anisodus acutangulus TaxID=402998 RepID=A0A9Q1LK47_9SOLA|nr:hypothetical protein K7X08_035256 [Anisodus acutangulus]
MGTEVLDLNVSEIEDQSLQGAGLDEEGGLNQQYECSPSTVTGKDGDRTSKWDMEIYTSIKVAVYAI